MLLVFPVNILCSVAERPDFNGRRAVVRTSPHLSASLILGPICVIKMYFLEELLSSFWRPVNNNINVS